MSVFFWTHLEESLHTVISLVLAWIQSSGLALEYFSYVDIADGKLGYKWQGGATCSRNLNRPLSFDGAKSGQQNGAQSDVRISPSANQRAPLFWEVEETPLYLWRQVSSEKWCHCMSDQSLMHEPTVDIGLTSKMWCVQFKIWYSNYSFVSVLAPKNYLRCQTIKLFTSPICIITQSLVLVALTIVLPSWNEDGDDDYDDDATKRMRREQLKDLPGMTHKIFQDCIVSSIIINTIINKRVWSLLQNIPRRWLWVVSSYRRLCELWPELL